MICICDQAVSLVLARRLISDRRLQKLTVALPLGLRAQLGRRARQGHGRRIEGRPRVVNNLRYGPALSQDVLLFAQLPNELVAVVDATAKRANFVVILGFLSNGEVDLRCCIFLGGFAFSARSRSSLFLTFCCVGIDWLRRGRVVDVIVFDCRGSHRGLAAFDHGVRHRGVVMVYS